MKTIHQLFFPAFVVAVSICYGQNETGISQHSDLTNSGNVSAPAVMSVPAATSLVPAPSPMTKQELYVKQDISTGTVLSTTGGVIFTTGAVMTLASIISVISASSYQSAVTANKTGAIGTILMAIGPIPSCSGASIVSSGLRDNTTDAPIESYWGNYGTGWGLEAVSVAASGLAAFLASGNDQSSTAGIIILAIGADAAGLLTFYQWGKAAWGPSLYISRIKRLEETHKIHFTLAPTFDLRGDTGLCLNVDF